MKEKNGKVKLTLVSAIFMALGGIIGAAIFASTPVAIKIVGGPAVVIGFLFGALFLLCKELPNVVMSSALPANGPSYMQTSRLVHPVLGMWNALDMLITGTLNISTLSLTFGTYFCLLFPVIPPWVASAVCLVGFTILSLYGLKASSAVQNIAVAVLVVVLLMYIILGMPHNTLTLKEVLFPTVKLLRLWAAIGILHGSLYGANALMYMAEDIENPRRNVPIAYIASTLGCAVLYAVIAWVTVGGPIPWFNINNLADVAKTFMSPGLLVFFITGGALLAVITSINAVMLMFSRINFVAARDLYFPGAIAKVNKHGAPGNALWVNTCIALVLILGRFNLADVTMITTIPGTLLIPLAYLPVFLVKKKYPLSYRDNFLKTPHWAVCAVSVIACVLSLVAGGSVLTQMGMRNWMTMVIYYGIGAVYSVFRYFHLKKKGYNLFKAMSTPYGPWEEHERELREAAKAQTNKNAG